MSDAAPPALAVEGLRIVRRVKREERDVVPRIDFTIRPGGRLAIVGESGSGKTITALALMGLLPPGFRVAAGAIRLDGVLVDPASAAMRSLRGRGIAIVFQDPMTALDPVMRIGAQITEAIRAHASVGEAEARRRAVALLDQVRITRASARLDAYPHEFSGGMRQRVTIAMALAHRPKVLIADEPSTALDVTTQVTILALIKELCREHGTALLLVSHDLTVVRGLCENVLVMRHGRVVEAGAVSTVLGAPAHPYTAALLRSVPPLDRDVEWLEAGLPLHTTATGGP